MFQQHVIRQGLGAGHCVYSMPFFALNKLTAFGEGSKQFELEVEIQRSRTYRRQGMAALWSIDHLMRRECALILEDSRSEGV